MEQFISMAIAELQKYGGPGLIIAYLIYDRIQLNKVIEAKDLVIKEKDAEIKASMEKRVDEAMKTVVTNGTLGPAIDKLARAVSSMDDSVNKNNEKLAQLTGRLGAR